MARNMFLGFAFLSLAFTTLLSLVLMLAGALLNRLDSFSVGFNLFMSSIIAIFVFIKLYREQDETS